MDYTRYQALIERYKDLGALSIDQTETRESLIKKLIDVSHEKKEILSDTNAIIREYITKFEKEPDLLDAEAVVMLEDFLVQLKAPGGIVKASDPLDPAISLRIARLLLQYYEATGDPEQIIPILQQCAIYDLMLKDHQDDHDSTPYSVMGERYMGMFGNLSEKSARLLIHCMTIGGYNKKDLTFGLRKYRENKDAFMDIRRKIGEDDLTIHYYYTLFKINALAYAVGACYRMEDAKNRGITLSEPLIDLEKDASMMEEFRDELEKILASELAQKLLFDRVSVKVYIAQTNYHLGKITLEELLALLEEYSKPLEDYNAYEQSSALLTAIPCYLDYLCRCSNYDRQYVQDKSIQLIQHILSNAEGALKELSEQSQYASSNAANRAVLQMINAASSFLDFEFFKRTVLNVTVYANKELYVHTMMVKEITHVLLEFILDHYPQYLDGVAGYDWQYCRDHKQEMLDLMESCALLHDIGKYYCLDIVNNSSRSLTDDEFAIIKEHPTNFSKIYQGHMDPEMECIRDCAELHHLWYNEEGGYPLRKHTANKPFVNILTIADCLDAATDSIGRPYGLGKTLEQVMAEFDDSKCRRYSGRIGNLLHVEEIQQKINYIIRERRKDFYCDVYGVSE